MASGQNFPALPGKYRLPWNEGVFIITGDGKLKMQTKGSGSWYVHDHVKLLNVDRDINLGFWSGVLAHGHVQDF